MRERPNIRIRPTFRPSRSGIGQVLGDLEREIMEALWRQDDSATVTETISQMAGERRAYHTVTTVMVRLCEKRMLQRRRRGGVWHYAPRLSREEFKRQVADEVIAGLYALAPESAVNSMLDLVDASHPKGLEELASLVERKRRERRRKK